MRHRPPDLTSVPQKEPKLSRARQIPEWEHLDAEIARFARRLADEGRISSDVAGAGVDALANVGGGAKAEEAEEKQEPAATEGDGDAVKEEPAPHAPRDEL